MEDQQPPIGAPPRRGQNQPNQILRDAAERRAEAQRQQAAAAAAQAQQNQPNQPVCVQICFVFIFF